MVNGSHTKQQRAQLYPMIDANVQNVAAFYSMKSVLDARDHRDLLKFNPIGLTFRRAEKIGQRRPLQADAIETVCLWFVKPLETPRKTAMKI